MHMEQVYIDMNHFRQKLTAWEWYDISQNISVGWNLDIPRDWNWHGSH